MKETVVFFLYALSSVIFLLLSFRLMWYGLSVALWPDNVFYIMFSVLSAYVSGRIAAEAIGQ